MQVDIDSICRQGASVMSVETSSESQRLRRELATLMSQARENERILRRYHALELALISAATFKELIDNVLRGYRNMADLDGVTLALIDNQYELRHMLPDLGIELSSFPDLLFLEDDAALSPLLDAAFGPVLSKYVSSRHAALFPNADRDPSSVAILPLVRQKRLVGSLNLASNVRGRFVAGLATDFMQRLAAIVAVCLENVVYNERLKHIGLIDPLTGTHNRRYLEQRLHEEADRAKRQGSPLSCLFIDIDHFKRINDTYGHQVGDRVLKDVATRIKGQLRLSDTLGRYGGEEFAALLTHTDRNAALIIAERIRRSIADEPFSVNDQYCMSVSLSIGVATTPDDHPMDRIGAVPQELIACADRALYRAKQSGRNCVM